MSKTRLYSTRTVDRGTRAQATKGGQSTLSSATITPTIWRSKSYAYADMQKKKLKNGRDFVTH